MLRGNTVEGLDDPFLEVHGALVVDPVVDCIIQKQLLTNVKNIFNYIKSGELGWM